MRLFLTAATACLSLSILSTAAAQRLEVPRQHDRPPGDPVSPEEAVAQMTVPEGFSVEIVAAEPDVVNPVAMFIDEKGRFWITESLEYPRREPGPGRDRIKVLEDTDGDGAVDKTTIFAEGLNIPSGIAVGYGGVWVANSPDILFLQDTDGDLKADKSEVVVTGFGRDDTHELPNSLTWGPDGWLYGLNGVFNYGHVKYSPENPNYTPDHPGWGITCALFRIHPRTRKFEVFAEGTSNPWGIAINNEGDFFLSACVIDHLWHIVESGYYIRQGGPYPPHTWPIESIVDHHHQKAAYCGITWFDSPAYPEPYRNVLYMGNIHGGCINADIVERDGATYFGKPHPGFPPKPGAWDHDQYGTIAKTGDKQNPQLADFLTANDAWFMPVVQKTGPDGCLYILDWYDRYHCYQDANADPEGIERAKGRLYRVRYQQTPRVEPFDLATKSDAELVALLSDPNVYYRDTAQRLLGERDSESAQGLLEAMIFDESIPAKYRMHAVWARAAFSDTNVQWIQKLLNSEEPLFRSWGIRLAAQRFATSQQLLADVGDLLAQRSDLTAPERLQLTIAIGESGDDRRLDGLLRLALTDDPTLQHLVWQHLPSAILEDPERFVDLIAKNQEWREDRVSPHLIRRCTELLVEENAVAAATLARFMAHMLTADVGGGAHIQSLTALVEAIRDGSLAGKRLAALKSALQPSLPQVASGTSGEFFDRFVELKALFGDQAAQQTVRERVLSSQRRPHERLMALQTLIAAGDSQLPAQVGAILDSAGDDQRFTEGVLEAIGRLQSPELSTALLDRYEQFAPNVRPRVIEVLTQRPSWSRALLAAIEAKKLDASLLNLNQLRRVASFEDKDLQQQFQKIYGTIREGRNPNREQVYWQMKDFLNGTPGDPFKGQAVFTKVCAQCHKIYGEGADVGPEITRNGRNNWDQLLQNVFDPSAVIGPGYQARQLATTDGRVLTGLPVEESDQRVVLKIQGGKLETIPREEIEVYKVSELSLMPEELEKLVTPQELADLFAYLALDKPPGDPDARILPGAPEQKTR